MRAVGYIRVSTDEQADSGAGLDAQRHAIEMAAQGRDWDLVCIEADAGYSAKTLDRPGIARVLHMLGNGEAEGVVVATLSRLSRSVADFVNLLDRSRREGWVLVALDLGVDTSSATGELVANVMSSVSQWERKTIGERTKMALAERKRRGVKLGRPRTLSDDVVGRIGRERQRGRSLRQIAAGLNADAIPTAQDGRCWYASTVRAVLLQKSA